MHSLFVFNIGAWLLLCGFCKAHNVYISESKVDNYGSEVEMFGNPVDRTWRTVPELMQGFWDNEEQIDTEVEEGVPPQERHSQISAIFFEVGVPLVFPADRYVVHYLQEYADGEPALVYRQRLYVFDEKLQGPSPPLTRNQIYSLTEPERFLNGWENPEIFEELTSDEMVWNAGCDLLWLWSGDGDFYRNNGTGDSCRTQIEGRETIIDVSNAMSPTWLTVDYAFIDVESGDIIIGWLTPFNMTKLGDAPPGSMVIPQLVAWPWIQTKQQDFETILAALVDGYQVEYAIDITQCSTYDGLPKETSLEVIGGPVKTFEYFYGDRFGPVPYFGSSLSNIILTEDEVHRIRLTQIRLYANETVRVRIVQGYLDQQDKLEFEEYDVLYCSTSDGPGGCDVFTIHDETPVTPLLDYDSILEAMYSGDVIRYSAHYYSCQPTPAETIAGLLVHGYSVNSAEDMITFHTGEMIVNYYIEPEDDGFLYNGGSGKILKNSSTTEFHAWGIEYGNWEVRYVSLYDCDINDGEREGGIYFYKL